jgi:CelD/BcsL family acetyltransferase involved in cellulose biosynthesis
MIDVVQLTDIDALEDYRLAWEFLLEQTASASFFQALDWLECYWKHYGADQTLRVLVVKDDHRPLGILPLVIRREFSRIGSLRVLTYPLHDWGSFYGPIGPHPTATLMAGLRHIALSSVRGRRDWDLLDLRWIDLVGGDRGRTQRAMEQAGFPPLKQKWDETSVIDLAVGWQGYWSSRDKKFRKNIERCERRLAEQGAIEFVRHRPCPLRCGGGDPRWDLYDECLSIAQRSWQGDSEDGTTLSHSQVRSFLRDAHEAAAKCGAADLNMLLISGKPVAYAYNYVYQGRVYGLRKGYDSEYRAQRPGLVLQKMMLEDGARLGDRSYDLGVGSSESKTSWQTGVSASYRYTYFPLTPVRAQLLRLNRLVRRRLRGENDVACSHSS